MIGGRYIVVEGPIAVGKTSLAKILADELDADLELDPTDRNTFLGAFNRDSERHALPTQLQFLLLRLEQQGRIASRLAEGRPVVSDYLFVKDEIFARLTLEETEYRLYRDLARAMLHGHHPSFVPRTSSSTSRPAGKCSRSGCASATGISSVVSRRSTWDRSLRPTGTSSTPMKTHPSWS